jgi:Ca-activated chloride channel family protein
MKIPSVCALLSCFALLSITHASQPEPSLQLTAELEQPVLATGAKQRVIVKIGLIPELIQSEKERPPVNLAIALDRSGSMNGDKIKQARNAALEALSLLRPQDRFALIAYADEAETLIESQHPLERERLARIIRQIQSGGSTAMYAGVSQAAAELRSGQNNKAFDRLILLSDGQANKGPSSIEDLRGLSRSLAGEDISISTVGLGSGFNEDLMTAIAETAQGNAYFAENSNDLTRIFGAELDDVLNVAATNVRIVVECIEGARPVRVIGRDGRIDNGTISFEINQLFGGQEKYALLEIDAPEGEDGDIIELLNVRVMYDTPDAEQPTRQSTTAQASYSDNEVKRQAAANLDVARAVVDNRIAEVKRDAIELSDRGDNKQAAQLMRELKEEVIQINLIYNDESIVAETDDIDIEAKQLEKSKLSNIQRKNYSSSSYQTVNQQKSID